MPKTDKVPDEKAADEAIAGEQEGQPSSEPQVAVEAEETEEREEAADISALQQQLEKQKEQSDYHLEQWKRTAANLANYRKRVEKERAELLRVGQAALIAQLLPILDDFGRAFQTLPFALSSFTWTEGLALIDRKLSLILEQQGLQEIEALGKPFDPALHQSLLEEETTAYPDGYVMAVLQKGYMLHDRVLRPVMVKVARNEQGSATPDSAETEGERSPETAEPNNENTEIK